MKTTYILMSLGLLVPFATQSCLVTITNDTDETVMLYNNKQGNDARELVPKEETQFGMGNEGPGKPEKADFILAQKSGDGGWVKSFHVYQEKCGMTDDEEKAKNDKFINISDVLRGDLGEELNELFVVEKYNEQAEMPKISPCCCKHKK